MEADFGDEQVKLIVGGISLLLTAAAPTTTYDWKLTPAGWGPVRIGMTREQVARALMAELSGEALDNEGSCIELFPEKEELRGTYFMFQGGKLSRISVVEAGKFATPRRIQVGSSAEEVRKAYGEKLETEPHHYLGEPAEYLTYWLKPAKSGVRFETDSERKVQTIHVGNDSIQLVEGCA